MESIALPKDLVQAIIQALAQTPTSICGHVWVALGNILEADMATRTKTEVTSEGRP